jgi:hypothetical protein
MAWDASRKVPWKKVLTPFALYAVVAIGLFGALGGFKIGLLVGVAAGGVVYAALAALMVKFGWNPPMFQSKEERTTAAQAAAERRAARDAAKGKTPRGAALVARTKPAATKRTNATNPKAKTTRR